VRGGHTQSRLPSGFFLYQPHPGSRLNTENFPQNPRNITFLHLETTPHHHHCTIANPRGGRARHSVRAAIGIQADKLSRLPLSHCFTLKKHIMQVPGFTTCYVRIQSAQDAGRVATGFPLPSTGRGIEGEGWSYPEPPPVRFFLYQHHPASKLNT